MSSSVTEDANGHELPIHDSDISKKHGLRSSSSATSLEGAHVPVFYLPPSTPDTKAAKFSFGSPDVVDERLGLIRSSSFASRPPSFLSRLSTPEDAEVENVYVPTVGCSRRMSRSLPELRDINFVSVLPQLDEEESETSENEPNEIINEKSSQPTWHQKLDFVLCSICQALGFSNFWRFPYYCYINGGGSFLYAYLIILLLCGLPLMCMELASGNITQCGPILALSQLCPLMKGVGVANTLISFWVTACYSVLIAWSLFFMFNSFYSPPRWTHCTNTWNTKQCKELQDESPTAEKLAEQPDIITESIFSESPETYFSTIGNFIDLENKTFNTVSEEVNAPLLLNTSIASSNLSSTNPAVEFFEIKMLETSKHIDELGELRFELLAAVLFVWMLVYFALRKSSLFKGTTIYVITVASHLLLFIFFLRTLILEGAKDGVHYLFVPDWERMADSRMWLYAAAQAFHTLSVVLGPNIVMGSCNKQNNLLRDAVILTGINIITVIMIGCVVFGTVGHLAVKMNQTVENVLPKGPGLVFVSYSILLGSMPLPSFWAVIFFIVLFCLGMDTQIKLMATVVTSFKEAYTQFIKHRFQGHALFLVVICAAAFVSTILYVTQAGVFFFQLTDHFIGVFAIVLVGGFEIWTLSWLYGTNKLASSIEEMTGKKPNIFFRGCWISVAPLGVLIILCYSIFSGTAQKVDPTYNFPYWSVGLGWLIFAFTVCWIPILAAFAYYKAPEATFIQTMRFTVQPRFRTQSGSLANPKPIIVLNGSSSVNDFINYDGKQYDTYTGSPPYFYKDKQDIETSF